MLDILVPVLGRPGNAQPLVDSIKAHTTVEHTILFLCSHHDYAEQDAVRRTGADRFDMPLSSGHGDYAAKINQGYRLTSSPFVFTAADDVEFTDDWDTAILAEAERTGAGMVGSDDNANPLVKRGRHSTHSLFSREYIDSVGGTFFDGPGVVYHQGYHHQWIDTESVKAAMDRGQWAFARRSTVIHHHPFYDKSAAMDATYTKGLSQSKHDSELYKQRLKQWSRRTPATVL